jgi:hypothetical protein
MSSLPDINSLTLQDKKQKNNKEHTVVDFLTKTVYIFNKDTDNKWTCGIDSCTFTNVKLGKLNEHLKTKKHNISAAVISRPTCTGYTTITGEACTQSFNSPAELKRHIIIHQEVKPYACSYDGCDYACSQAGNLKSHVSTVHLKESNFACLVKDCGQAFARADHLAYHHASIHARSMLKAFPCDMCLHVSHQQSHLTQHKADMHKVNVNIKYCTIDDCTKEFTQSSNLKSHQRDIHGINPVLIPCGVESCTKIFSTNGNLFSHQAFAHEINKTEYKCDIDDCLFICGTKHNLNIHKLYWHTNDADVHWCHCDVDGCKKKFKQNHILTRHKSNMHDIDVTWYNCDIDDNCMYAGKNTAALNSHHKYRHDIGKNKCDLCQYDHYSHITYMHKDNKLKICKKCFKEKTGKDSRSEVRMSDYLDSLSEIKDFIIGTDISFKSLGGCSLKRPDKMCYSPGLAMVFECDEFEHSRSNGHYSCDENRIIDISAEFDTNLVVIRWNPDKYKTNNGADIVLLEDRLIGLKNLIIKILANPPTDPIYCYYMYYSDDNVLLPENINYEIVH